MTGIDRGTNISSSPARPAMTIFYAIFPKILVNFGSFWKLSTFGSTFGSWRSSNRTSVVVCDRLCLRLLRWSLKRWIWSRWKICALVIFFSGIWEPDYFDWVFWHNWMMLDVHPHGFLVMYGRFDPFPTSDLELWCGHQKHHQPPRHEAPGWTSWNFDRASQKRWGDSGHWMTRGRGFHSPFLDRDPDIMLVYVGHISHIDIPLSSITVIP